MRIRALLHASLPLLALILLGGARGDPSPREEMRFGVEAARQGLWREAIFRWERALKDDPRNAHVRNNLAVAYESLGQFDRALAEYQEALRLDPDNKEIRDNYASYQELHKPRSASPAASAAPAVPSGGP